MCSVALGRLAQNRQTKAPPTITSCLSTIQELTERPGLYDSGRPNENHDPEFIVHQTSCEALIGRNCARKVLSFGHGEAP